MRRSSGDVPFLAVPVLAGGDGVDGTALSFLVRRAVEDRKRGGGEGEEEEGGVGEGGPGAREEGPVVGAAPRRHKAMEEWLNKASSSSKRKRKKRRKRRTPRTSSLPGRARRRQRQWFACSAGFTGDDVPRVRPKMLRIMAGMDQEAWFAGI